MVWYYQPLILAQVICVVNSPLREVHECVVDKESPTAGAGLEHVLGLKNHYCRLHDQCLYEHILFYGMS